MNVYIYISDGSSEVIRSIMLISR